MQRAIDYETGMLDKNSTNEHRKERSNFAKNVGKNVKNYANFALDITNQGSMTTSNTSRATVIKNTQVQSVFNTRVANNNIEFSGLNKRDGDNFSVNNTSAYGNEFNNKVKKSTQIYEKKEGRYIITAFQKDGTTIANGAYNIQTGNTVYMKPNELNTFIQAEQNVPVLNDMIENTPNYKHTAKNALFNDHDNVYVDGVITSWKNYGRSGDIILNLAGGVTGKFVNIGKITTPTFLTKGAEAYRDLEINTSIYLNSTIKPTVSSGVRQYVNTVKSINNVILQTVTPTKVITAGAIVDTYYGYKSPEPAITGTQVIGGLINKVENYKDTKDEIKNGINKIIKTME